MSGIGMTVALCSQTYGPVDPVCAKTLRVATMHASNHGVIWAGDASPDRLGYSAARNTGAQHTLGLYQEAEGIMWVDSDMKLEPDQISRLLGCAKANDLEFLSGVYHQRTGYHNPVFYGWNVDKKCMQPAYDYAPNTLDKADGCGFGFVYTSSKLLYDIAMSKDFDIKTGWFPDKRDAGGMGEDLTFCRLAMLAGHQLWVHTGIQVCHQGNPKWVSEEHFRQKQAEWFAEGGEEQKLETWGVK